MQFNILVFSYRDRFFSRRYGHAVRDIQMIEALARNPRVKSVYVVDRPITIYERILGKQEGMLETPSEKITYLKYVSYDIIGPLKTRLWTETCYDHFLDSINSQHIVDSECVKVLLDFTPIAKLNYRKFGDYYVWYDLIDNIVKHNRFSLAEKTMVEEKYRMVGTAANLITGVSDAALERFSESLSYRLSNGILSPAVRTNLTENPFTFGFTGFLTDKFDVSTVIEKLASSNRYTIAIFGKVMDSAVEKRLKKHKNIHFFGEFNHRDMPEILSRFRIGLIPYLLEKSHDESPIKLYEYLNAGKGVLTTQDFEIAGGHIGRLDLMDSEEIDKFVDSYGFPERASSPNSFLDESCLWENKISLVLDRIEQDLCTRC